ncbi:hypothetical protein ACFS07_28085 [Undibacterium arcticum]
MQQALAVRDGRIIYVGTNEGASQLIGTNTKVTDLGGRMLMPGLIDAHMHPMFGGRCIAHVQSRICGADHCRVSGTDSSVSGCVCRE